MKIGYTAQEVALVVARSLLWVRERPKGSNRGEAVEHLQGVVHLQPGQPWCAGYVGKVGSALEGWPLPLVGGCVSLYDAAQKKGLVREEPAPGAVFLLWLPVRERGRVIHRFAHTGFCVAPGKGRWATYEGNTNGGGEREGWGAFEKSRQWGPKDRFIWWWEGR
jgi:hypothetical protein